MSWSLKRKKRYWTFFPLRHSLTRSPSRMKLRGPFKISARTSRRLASASSSRRWSFSSTSALSSMKRPCTFAMESHACSLWELTISWNHGSLRCWPSMKYMPAAFRGFIVFRPDPKRYRNRASCVAKAVRTVLIFRKMAALRQYRRMSSPALTASVSCLPSPSRMCVTSPWKWNQVDSNIRRSKSKLRFVSTPTRKNRFCVPLSSNPASISSSRFRRSLRSRWKRDCRRATLAAKSRSEAPSTPSPSEPAPTPMAMGCAAMLS
mmetsp:Transcript_2961/g.11995  ORF Transcript_2961/g.11995 Transcript_2961/m.11995 type:complete len:263 (+) Transcript_2961:1001-1789(+)